MCFYMKNMKDMKDKYCEVLYDTSLRSKVEYNNIL